MYYARNMLLTVASTYLDDVCQASALIGMERPIQPLSQPGAQHLDLVSVPVLRGQVEREEDGR